MSLTNIFELLGAVSFLTFIGSLIAVPWLIGRLPPDYFIRHRQKLAERRQRHPLLAIIIFVTRNIVGCILLVAGIAMLVLPGQGILTMLIGISFMDFAGKQRLVDHLVNRPRMKRILNWVRKRGKKPPFEFL